MGSNPVEVLNFSFLRERGLIFNIAEITLTAMMFISSISFIFMAVKYLISRVGPELGFPFSNNDIKSCKLCYFFS